GWRRQKALAVNLRVYEPEPSEFADKELESLIAWTVRIQSSKIYRTEAEARNGEWLPLPASWSPGVKSRYQARFSFAGGKWTLDELDTAGRLIGKGGKRGGPDLGGPGGLPRGVNLRPTDDPWWQAMTAAERK